MPWISAPDLRSFNAGRPTRRFVWGGDERRWITSLKFKAESQRFDAAFDLLLYTLGGFYNRCGKPEAGGPKSVSQCFRPQSAPVNRGLTDLEPATSILSCLDKSSLQNGHLRQLSMPLAKFARRFDVVTGMFDAEHCPTATQDNRSRTGRLKFVCP